MELLSARHVKSEFGLGKARHFQIAQQFPGVAFLQTDAGSIRSCHDAVSRTSPTFGTPFLLAMDFALAVRDALGSKTIVIDYALDIVLLIHVMQEPVSVALSPLRVNRKLDKTERLRKENESAAVSFEGAVFLGPEPLVPVRHPVTKAARALA